MNAAAATTVSPQATEPWTAFVAWMADELGMRLECDDKVYRAVPEPLDLDPQTVARNPRKSWLLRRKKPTEDPASTEPPVEADSPSALAAALIQRLKGRGRLAHLKPIAQPSAVHEITHRLFRAYTLDGGKAHVAGCSLEDVPFIRFSTIDPTGDEETRVLHAIYDEQGAPVDPELVSVLGLDQVEPFGASAPRRAEDLLAELLNGVRRSLEASGDTRFRDDATVASLVWAKRASGLLSFEFGEEVVETPFDGWSKTLVAPPVCCPLTGKETFHLATVEGGTIAAAEEIAESDVTGLRRVRGELLCCSETGRRGEADWFGSSKVTGQPVLLDQMTTCERCGLQIARSETTAVGCAGCEHASRVAPDEPRMKTIAERYPDLTGKGWRLAETARAYVLLREGWLTNRVATIDKETLDLIRNAQRSRFSSVWSDVRRG